MAKSPLISIVFGTRPEIIKLAPVIIKLKANSNIRSRVICSGQHKDIVKPIMKIFDIREDLNLGIMKKKQTLNHVVIETIRGLEKEFNLNKPDLVLVQGDTSTAFATALCAFNKQIKIGHIEAGLRTDNLGEPYPEEGNRRLISQISKLHFAPTNLSKENLINSNVKEKIFVTGNTVIDSLLYISRRNKKLKIKNNIINNKKYILATIHRRENWGVNLEDICKGLKLIVQNNQDLFIVLPMHPNQSLRNRIIRNLDNCEKIILCEAVPYDIFVNLMEGSKMVITDSGGLQEEAPSLNKPVLVLRNNTERIEAIEAGTAKIIGTNPDEILKISNYVLNNSSVYEKMASANNPFGDGLASDRIIKKSIMEIS